ncbi:MAG: PEGA domain-containing protein [Methanomicrobiales archaeon]
MLAISITTAASAYTITATAVGHGTIEPSGMVTINPGDNSPPFWITPDSGYRSVMTIDGAVVAGSQGYTFINVNSDHALSVTFAPDTGSLSVNSYPVGAIIYIDRVNVGLTPEMVEVLVGTHELRLVLAGYNDYTTTVTMEKGKTTKVDRNLVQQIPTPTTTTPVSVSSTPSGASVNLDGINMGTTPLSIHSVSYGTHTMRLTYPGYQDSSNRVDVSETSNAYEYTLTPTGQVSIVAPESTAVTNPTPTIGTSSPNTRANVPGNTNILGIQPPAMLLPLTLIIFLFIALIPLIPILAHDYPGLGHLSFSQSLNIRAGVAIGHVACGAGLLFVISRMIPLLLILTNPRTFPLLFIALILVAYLIISAFILAIESLQSRPLRWTMRVHGVIGVITLVVTPVLLFLFARGEVMAILVTIVAAPVSAFLALWQDHTLVFHQRQMSTLSTFPGFHKIQEFGMPAAGEDTKSLTNTREKTNKQQLYNELEDEYGFPPATCHSLVQLMNEFVEDNYGNLRNDIHIIYHAVRSDEPPEKPLDCLRLIPVLLTISQPDDADILRSQGISGLRKHKLQRLSKEAYDHGGQFLQEDLALLLTTSIRTIQRDIKELREQGIEIPTRV